MTDYVVDTDVVSYGFRQDTRFDFYRPLLAGNQAFVSFMTIAELEFWGSSRNWGGQGRRQQLEAYIRRGRLDCSDRNSAERSVDDQ